MMRLRQGKRGFWRKSGLSAFHCSVVVRSILDKVGVTD